MKTRLLVFALLLPMSLWAQSYTQSTLVDLPSVANGPVLPTGGLIIDGAGHLYGAAQGGANNLGAIFRVSAKGVVTVLHSFSGSDGSYPEANLVRDKAGNLYGTTSQGGTDSSCSCGTVFKLAPNGHLTVLYSFTGGYGYPSAILLDNAGNLYGYDFATNANGSIFKITPSGVFSIIYNFCSLANCADGTSPTGRLILNKNGNFYGATNRGGAFNEGTVFQLTPAYAESVLYSFTGGSDGANPTGKLTQDQTGTMYGVTYQGGTPGSGSTIPSGTVFKITTAGVESVLYSFCQQAGCTDGANPLGSLFLDGSSTLYGTTTFGGTNNAGVVFKVSTAGAESVLDNLTIDADGGNGAVVDKKGNVFVEMYSGGASGDGWVMELAK